MPCIFCPGLTHAQGVCVMLSLKHGLPAGQSLPSSRRSSLRYTHTLQEKGHGALGKVESPTRTCQSDYELLAGVVTTAAKHPRTPTKASGAAGVERHQSPSTTRPPSQATSPRGGTRMATQGLVGMRHHNRLSPTSPLQELQTTTSSA